MSCPLCELKIRDKVYYEDEYFIVLDSVKNKIPMVVLKRHDGVLNQKELIDLMWIFNILHFDGEILYQQRKSVPNHWHVQIGRTLK